MASKVPGESEADAASNRYQGLQRPPGSSLRLGLYIQLAQPKGEKNGTDMKILPPSPGSLDPEGKDFHGFSDLVLEVTHPKGSTFSQDI